MKHECLMANYRSAELYRTFFCIFKMMEKLKFCWNRPKQSKQRRITPHGCRSRNSFATVLWIKLQVFTPYAAYLIEYQNQMWSKLLPSCRPLTHWPLAYNHVWLTTKSLPPPSWTSRRLPLASLHHRASESSWNVWRWRWCSQPRRTPLRHLFLLSGLRLPACLRERGAISEPPARPVILWSNDAPWRTAAPPAPPAVVLLSRAQLRAAGGRRQ